VTKFVPQLEALDDRLLPSPMSTSAASCQPEALVKLNARGVLKVCGLSGKTDRVTFRIDDESVYVTVNGKLHEFFRADVNRVVLCRLEPRDSVRLFLTQPAGAAGFESFAFEETPPAFIFDPDDPDFPE
jgi:hypothetical protein